MRGVPVGARLRWAGRIVGRGCGACSGIGRALVFDYPKAGRPRGCAGCGDRFAGRELFEVGDDNLTFFEGDELCRGCTAGHGVL